MKKILLVSLLLVIMLTGCGEKAETTTNGYHSANLVQGFGFLPSRENPVGYITYLKIGDLQCAADLQVADPMNPTNKIQVLGVVSWLTWRESPNDPIVFAAQVSGANKDKLAALGKTDLTNSDIEFAFSLYQYDLKTRVYYKSLSSSSVLKGTLHKEGNNVLFLMSADSGVDVQSPENFNFQLGVDPKGAGQVIQVAGVEKGWGGGK